MESVVNPNSGVYYSGQYWNDLPRVLEYMCENFTGDKRKWWTQDFQERYGDKPFESALVLNCGNGWVEREFIDRGIAKHVVAFDYSFELLQSASKEKGARPIAYFRADANRIDFPDDCFDLIVNVAALHHVQYLDRLCRILCRALQPHGIFVNYDYIGPYRNQYSWMHWFYIQRVNRTLPLNIRKEPLEKPHLPTMLHTDPTEAIHSNLIVESVARYFDVIERHDTGGGIAYEILTHNPKLKTISAHELNPLIDRVLAFDKQYTHSKRVPPLFSYFLARPNKNALRDTAVLRRAAEREHRREAWARAHLGTYSTTEYLFALVLPKLVEPLRRLKRIFLKFRP